MRNYNPTEPASYTFNGLLCRFTSDELSKYLRDEASRISRESEDQIAKISELRKHAESENAERHGLSREEMVQAIDEMEATERARAARVVQQLNFVAQYIAKDAVFELEARDVLNIVGHLSEDRHGLDRVLGKMRGYRMLSESKTASKTIG